MEYTTEKAWGDWEINKILTGKALEGWKPMFMTPIVEPRNNEGSGGGGAYNAVSFIIFFERKIK